MNAPLIWPNRKLLDADSDGPSLASIGEREPFQKDDDTRRHAIHITCQLMTYSQGFFSGST